VYAGGEKTHDNKSKVVTLYRYYRPRLWVRQDDQQITIVLPAAMGEVAQQCRWHNQFQA